MSGFWACVVNHSCSNAGFKILKSACQEEINTHTATSSFKSLRPKKNPKKTQKKAFPGFEQ